MKNWVALLALMMTGSLLWSQARISVPQEEQNLGEVKSGAIVELSFTFQNIGNQDLDILRVNSSCGCAVPRLEKSRYKPGEKGVVPIKFYSQGMDGKVQKIVSLYTNDPERPYVNLRFTAQVALTEFADLRFSTEAIALPFQEAGTVHEGSLNLFNPGTFPLKIHEITLPPEMSLEMPAREIPPGESIRIPYRFRYLEPPLALYFVTFKTNAHRKPLCRVRIDRPLAPASAP